MEPQEQYLPDGRKTNAQYQRRITTPPTPGQARPASTQATRHNLDKMASKASTPEEETQRATVDAARPADERQVKHPKFHVDTAEALKEYEKLMQAQARNTTSITDKANPKAIPLLYTTGSKRQDPRAVRSPGQEEITRPLETRRQVVWSLK
jgi:hypothetical protein